MMPSHALGRRPLLGAAAAAALPAGSRAQGGPQGRHPPITIIINQSPWLDSFQRLVAQYERESGNRVELDVNPFAGSLEKQRNSVRAARGGRTRSPTISTPTSTAMAAGSSATRRTTTTR